MDLDTNVKNVRYSNVGKLVCLVLCFITMLSCISVGLNTIASYAYFGEGNRDKCASFTDSSDFKWSLARDLSTINSAFQAMQDGEYEYYDYVYCKNINIYAEKGKFSSVESGIVRDKHYDNISFTAEEAKAYAHYLVYDNGVISSNGFSDVFISFFKNWFDEFDVLYIYLDFSAYDNGNVIDKLELYDHYAASRDYFDTAVKYYDGMNTYIVLAVILFILSLAFGISYFTVAGKKNGRDKAKLAFIDYVPLELHLGVSIGLGFGAGCLMLIALNEFELPSKLGIAIVCLFAAVVWFLLIELTASIIRAIRSDRKFYKFLLAYWILYSDIKLNVRIFRGIIECNKRIIRNLSYRPKAVRRNVIILLVGYLLSNAILLMFVAFGLIVAVEDNPILFFIAILFFMVFNIAVIILAMKYIRQLDEVADHMISHTDFNGDIMSFPPMLRELVKSMQFTNEELRHAVDKAVKDERLRTELITNVSHDLKTPLTSIINYVDLLSKCNIEDDKAKSYIGVLEDKGAKLKRLIDDLMEASKVTSGNVTVNLVPINLSELCLQATVEAQEEFEKAGLSLVVKPQSTPNIVIADGSKTYRIIENLLSNARKYSAMASRVYVDVYNENGCGVFEIKNVSAQPLDISADELTERFVRGDKSRNQEGNGLGLSIAKELARLQNGNLEIIIDGDLFKARVKLPSR